MKSKVLFKELVNGDIFVLVDFFVEWCGLCKVMVFVLQEVVGDIGEKVKIVKIDVDKNFVIVEKL